jgi:hypothetical protein
VYLKLTIRILFFFRDPVERVLSCYKYFCLQENSPQARCNTEELQERIFQGILSFRSCACNNQFAGSTNPPYKQCLNLQPLVLKSKPKSPFERFSWESSDFESLWPMDDPVVMANEWWTCFAAGREQTHQCGMMEGVYWNRLVEWLNVWPIEQVMNVIDDDFLTNATEVMRSSFRFFGVDGLDDFVAENTNAAAMNVAAGADRRSNSAKLTKDAREVLKRLFTPHLEKHVQILKFILDGRLGHTNTDVGFPIPH